MVVPAEKEAIEAPDRVAVTDHDRDVHVLLHVLLRVREFTRGEPGLTIDAPVHGQVGAGSVTGLEAAVLRDPGGVLDLGRVTVQPSHHVRGAIHGLVDTVRHGNSRPVLHVVGRVKQEQVVRHDVIVGERRDAAFVYDDVRITVGLKGLVRPGRQLVVVRETTANVVRHVARPRVSPSLQFFLQRRRDRQTVCSAGQHHRDVDAAWRGVVVEHHAANNVAERLEQLKGIVDPPHGNGETFLEILEPGQVVETWSLRMRERQVDAGFLPVHQPLQHGEHRVVLPAHLAFRGLLQPAGGHDGQVRRHQGADGWGGGVDVFVGICLRRHVSWNLVVNLVESNLRRLASFLGLQDHRAHAVGRRSHALGTSIWPAWFVAAGGADQESSDPPRRPPPSAGQVPDLPRFQRGEPAERTQRASTLLRPRFARGFGGQVERRPTGAVGLPAEGRW